MSTEIEIPQSNIARGISIIIPAYNEEGAIGKTIGDINKMLPDLGRPAEVLVVDDGSTDNTAGLAQAAGVRVIRRPINGGYGRALMTGIISASYDTIAIVDADDTYPIDRLPELAVKYDEGFQMVVGSRQGIHFDGSWFSRLQRMAFRFLAEFAAGRAIPDVNSGFRIFDRRPVLEVKGSFSTGFSFTCSLTLLFLLTHLHVAYLPVPYHRRIGETKVKKLKDALRALQIIVTFFAQFNPLKLYLLLLLVCWGGNIMFGVGLWLLVGTASAAFLVTLVAWNVGCLLGACTILSLVLLRPDVSIERLIKSCRI